MVGYNTTRHARRLYKESLNGLIAWDTLCIIQIMDGWESSINIIMDLCRTKTIYIGGGEAKSNITFLRLIS
jgi:hypothetical protein